MDILRNNTPNALVAYHKYSDQNFNLKICYSKIYATVKENAIYYDENVQKGFNR